MGRWKTQADSDVSICLLLDQKERTTLDGVRPLALIQQEVTVMLAITRRKSTSAALICLLSVSAMSLTACAESADSKAASSESASPTSTVENTPSPSTTDTGNSPTVSSTPSTQEGLAPLPGPTPSGSSPLPGDPEGDSDFGVTPQTEALPPPVDGGELHLANFHKPEAWEENLYDVADRRQVSGMASVVGCENYFVSGAELEIRMGNRYKLLTFSVGQGQDSETSDATMLVTITQNGKQTEVKKLRFGKVLDFSMNVTNVNALKIGFEVETPDSQSGNSCGDDYQVKAVVFDARIA